jgi:hypothetical protein
MIITPVDSVTGLYQVDQVYNIDLLDLFLAEDLSNVPHVSLPGQENWLRKNYRLFTNAWKQLQQSIDYSEINKLGYLTPTPFNTVYWIDQPGFSTGIHQDNPAIFASMQVYLGTADELGTQFVDSKNHAVFTVPYKKNSGYLLINTGQPHGFPDLLQKIRHSTYTWLTPKS